MNSGTNSGIIATSLISKFDNNSDDIDIYIQKKN